MVQQSEDDDPGPRVGTHLASMMTLSEVGIDFDRANAARIYDHFLGGAHNFASDRAQAAKIVAGNPDMPRVCRENRAFLGRIVRWCLDQGVDQFLDLGSGVPTVGNVHVIARALRPTARVAYVDFEPVAVHHAREITAGIEGVTVVQGDLRRPEAILRDPAVTALLDFDRPVAVLAIAVLHFIDDDLPSIFGRYRAALCPGSVLALNHGSADQDDPVLAEAVREIQRGYRGAATPVVLREREQIRELLDGFELVAPGLVDPVDWPVPQPHVEPIGAYAAVGRAPDRT
jgi:SAM-dependent methyltransferase